MDSEDSEEEVEYTGMLQPPLTKMLKNILAEYPDDGQILKELIQNAEDAEASEVKLLLDTRDINSDEVNSKKRPFYKYFRGPAMFFYNNAEFTEKDWEGIRMLYSSVKELDPLKVGRFGLGFKSVFHITDYPMIVSNDRLLIIDPHQTDHQKVCQTIRLRSLPKCKQLKEDEYRSALFGIFGFSEETIRSGRFNGTLFRFPLRKTPTELSDNLYNAKRVTGMLKSFKEEASLTLLFLRFLHSIDLYVNYTKHSIHCTIQPLYSVQMSRTSSEKVMQNRLKFSRAIQQNSQQSLTDINDVTICSQALDKQGNVILEETKTWVVINVFQGSGISQTLRNLSNDESLSYSPCVGIAAPMTVERGFKGHVFCFLPLPLEPRSLTGLPVHVNGYFSLSQNRRHVKWPSADQTGEYGHLDKAMQWNQCLVQEVLSQTYVHLIEYLVSKCKEENNPKDMVSMVYRVIPPVDESIDDRWRIMVRPFLDSILQRDILFTEYNGGTWLKPVDAVFGRFDPGIDHDVQDTVTRIAKKYNQKLVEVPDHIWQLVRQNVPNHSYLSSDFVTRLLKSSPSYTECSSTDKQNLLKFLVENDDFSNLQDLELLPLADGSFTNFNSKNPIFYCSENECIVCQAYTDRIVKIELQPGVRSIVRRIAEREIFQLRMMQETDVVSIIGNTCDTYFEKKYLYMEWDTSNSRIKADWIDSVWRYIGNRSLSSFQNLSIVPQSDGRLVLMYKLCDTILLSENQLSDQLVRALQYFPVLVLQNIPEVMEHKYQSLKQYMCPPTSKGICQVFVEVYNRKDRQQFITHFNNKAGREERLILTQCINPEHVTANTCLTDLDIFKVYRQEIFTSVSREQRIAANNYFPVSLPCTLISPDQIHLATRLGAWQITEHDMMLLGLQEGRYTGKETQTLMFYFMSKIDLFKSRSDVMRLARDVCFVVTSSGHLKRARDLWSPSKLLQVLLKQDKTKFPDRQYRDDSKLSALKLLGMKDENDITPDMIYNIALAIDRENAETGATKTMKEQLESILLILKQRCSLLDEYLDRRTLKDCLKDLCFLQSMDKPQLYPDVVPWFGRQDVLYSPHEMLHGSAVNQRLVGTSMPLVTTLPDVLIQSFDLCREPSVEKVLEQLLKMSEIYKDQYKPDILPFLKDIYQFLSNCTYIPKLIQEHRCIWVGNGFEMPHEVFLQPSHITISTEPYMYLLPREFHEFYTFFLNVGCMECQTDDTLIDVLYMVRKNHDSNTRTAKETDRDLNLVIQILNYLKNTGYDGTREILFPVHTRNSSLQLRLAKECHYSNDDWLREITEDDNNDDVVFVHADIPGDTAEKLGVPSLTESLFGDAEGMEEWGQTEPLTRRIKCILREYKDGFSVPKEIVQNADDAGATEVYFLYDERENDTPDFKTRLIDEQMSECQGPALWAYNNAEFTKEDLSNITKLSAATKENDASKIGKFGLGFCSVYNLTDVPSFVSGSDVVIFDPHYKYLGKAIKNKQPGVKINMKSLKNRTLLRRMKNQFKPFKDVFGCDLGDTIDRFNGTLFRFPLRTTKQANESEISDVAYSKKEMEELIEIFLKGVANTLLFSQNVTEIRFFHLSKDETNPQNAQLISSVQRKLSNIIPQHLKHDYSQHSGICILQETSTALQQQMGRTNYTLSDVSKSMKTIYSITVTNEATKMLPKVQTQTTCTDWFIAWTTGTGQSLNLALQSSVKGAVHLASVAIPVDTTGQELILKTLAEVPFGFYKESHLFCFLPLPYTSSLPVHVNAAFSVSSDRRRLLTKTDDDKNCFEGQWNNALMCDAVPNAYLFLLESIKDFIVSDQGSVWNLWPSVTNVNDQALSSMHRHFYSKIVNEVEKRLVFNGEDTWMSFNESVFLNSELVHSHIGDIATKAIKHFRGIERKPVVEIPSFIESAFIEYGYADILEERTITMDIFLSEIFFPNIRSRYWSPCDRNQIVRFALKSMKCLEGLQQDTGCIPTSPSGRLRKPSDVIHPQSSWRNLFTDDDERLIPDSFDVDEECLQTLETLGIIKDILPDQVVIEKANSVHKMDCSNCSEKRSRVLIQYLNELRDNETVKQQMKDLKCIPFLPVLPKIQNWPFTWKADENELVNNLCLECEMLEDITCTSIRFAAPTNAVHVKHKYLVGSEKCLLDTDNCHSDVLSSLGVTCEVAVDTVYRQMVSISTHVNPQVLIPSKRSILTKIFDNSYSFLDDEIERLRSKSSTLDVSILHKYPVFLLGEHFIFSNQLALNLTYDVSPHLFCTASSMLGSHESLLTALNIKDHFPAEKIFRKILENQNNFDGRPLELNELEHLKRLLELLTDTMQSDDVSVDQLHNTQEEIDETMLPCQEWTLHNSVEEKHGTEIRLPDQDRILRPLSKLCINDKNLDIKETSLKVVHEIISHRVAKSLGVITIKQQILSSHIKTRRFGQREELTERIQRILSGYPRDDGIFKELIQNADDAGASEIHFVTDFKSHPTDKLFNEEWKSLQGPALLVFNDSEFTEKDIEGIQKLGTGSKGSDSSKTGQFGVGFNVVYHITDVPSFITKGPNVDETLCVMDPNRLYVDAKDKYDTGVQYCDLHDLRMEYEDVFVTYHEDVLLADKGTVFRFPLRTSGMAESSKVSKDAIDEHCITALLSDFKKSAFESLLFLKNLRRIRISDITSNDLNISYEVTSTCLEQDCAAISQYNLEINSLCEHFPYNSKHSPKQVQFVKTLKDNENRSESFLIVQRYGCNTVVDPLITKALEINNLNILPHGGIAVPVELNEQWNILPNDRKESDCHRYRAFCVLPLPILTGLPFHVNGNFALDHEARRTLWQDVKQNYKSMWNKLILEHVIAPCFNTIMLSFKQNIEDNVIDNDKCSSPQAELLLRRYHSVLPDWSEAKDDNWKTLVRCIYGTILDAEIAIFVSILPYPHESEKLNTDVQHQKSFFEFIPIRKKSESFESVSISGRSPSLVTIVRKIGLRVLNTPDCVIRGMQKAGYKIQNLTPEYLTRFLKSYKMNGETYRCTIGLTDQRLDISRTQIESQKHLMELYNYCSRTKNFAEEIDSLPLCLTQDSKLQVFRKNEKHFRSKFADILPESASLFLDKSFAEAFVPLSVSHHFAIDDFISLLPFTLQPEKFYSREYFTGSKDLPDRTWIKRVWEFIHDQLKCKNVYSRDKRNFFLRNHLGSWCLLPCKRAKKQFKCQDIKQQDFEEILLPVYCIDEVLKTSSFKGATHLRETFENLNIPMLNYECLPLHPILAKIIPSMEAPFDVLNCIYHHKIDIEKLKISIDDCNTILTFISNNLPTILEDSGSDVTQQVKDRIKALPMHVTVYGEVTSLDSPTDVVVLPLGSLGIPNAGITTWASKSRTTLLRQNDNLKSIHDLLGYSMSSLCDVYSLHILPKIRCLPCEDYVHHLQFIRTKLLRSCDRDDNDPEQQRLIDILRVTPLIGQTDRTASSFYSKKTQLFEMMCQENEFLPEPYCNKEWQTFLELIGLNTKVTEELFIKFAETVANDRLKTLTDNTRRKSELLLQELLKWKKTSADFLETAAHIRFVLPYKVSKKYNDIFPQYERGRLIPFSHSIHPQYTELAWTTCHILPVLSDDDVKKLLQFGIQIQPPPEEVIRNLQNISCSLKAMIEKFNDSFSPKTVVKILSKIFSFLQENKNDRHLLNRMLGHAPIIYLQQEMKMVACYQIVIGLQSDDVIRPHLYKAPTDFGPYFTLFKMLGTATDTSFKTYARILEEIHMTLKDDEFHLNESETLRKVVSNFFRKLSLVSKEEQIHDIGVGKLYLPTDKHMLKEAREVIIPDLRRKALIHRIQGQHFLLELDDQFRLIEDNIKYVVNKLPEKHRPRLLSDHINTTLHVVPLENQKDTAAATLHDFINSQEFVDGFYRLITDDDGADANKEISKSQLVKSLKQIKIIQVHELHMTLTFRGEQIAEDYVDCMHEKSTDDELLFYIKDDPDANITTYLDTIDIRLCRYIEQCTGHGLSNNNALLVKILGKVDRPHSISKILHAHNIKDDCSERDAVPIHIGRFVEPKWNHMLINLFCEFDVGEYVAVITNMDRDESEDDIYLYAQIKKKIQDEGSAEGFGVKYEVQVDATTSVIKYAYELFKFSRRANNNSSKIVPLVDVDNNASMRQDSCLDEIHRDIVRKLNVAWTLPVKERAYIIRRILRTWHPDRKFGQAERATEVFTFIKTMVRILERDGMIEMDNDDTDQNPSSTQQPGSSNYETMFDNVDRQCGRERQHYEAHFSNTSHPRSVPEPVPHPAEARKWYRQACSDFRAAKKFLHGADEIKFCNWICYMCHQAAEKAFIALMYNKDANSLTKSEILTTLSRNTNPELRELANELQTLTGTTRTMRYPDQGRIPAELYDREQAERAVTLSEKIISKVDEDF